MTVINMLSLGNAGLAVADEQSSHMRTLRKYNLSQKLKVLDDSIIYGGSGAADPIGEVYDIIMNKIAKSKKTKDNITLPEIGALAEKSLMDYKNSFKSRALYGNLGITINEYLTGINLATSQPLDEHIKREAKELCAQADKSIGMGMLLGGIQNEQFEIYDVSFDSGLGKSARPYESIGSGNDESDKVLSKYIVSLPREKRNSIDKQEGLIKIIEATNASSNGNVGVGGAPSIAYISKDGIIMPSESQSILASEIVEGYTRRLLTKNFAYNAASKLVYNDGNVEIIEDKMKTKCRDWKKLDRLLRGYKE